MRDMFDSYSNLSDIYVPNNSEKRLYEYINFNDSIIKKEYNIKNDFIGYSWSYGTTLTIPYSLNKIIYVEEDALVFAVEGEEPTTETIGVKGQRAYNTYDIKSWTCETLDQTIYNWVEDKEFVYPINGTKEITLVTEKETLGKTVLFTIKNFRHEVVYSNEYPVTDTINLIIDEELSKKLLKGTYNCYIDLIEDDLSFRNCAKFNITIIDSDNFKDNLGAIII
jgi:hypothetical protein